MSYDREKNTRRMRKYRAKYKEQVNAYQRTYNETYLKTEKSRRSRSEHYQKIKSDPVAYEVYCRKRLEYGRKRRNKLKEEVFKVLGDKCARCGFDDKRALQIDHINGNGYAELRKLPPDKFLKKVAKVGKKEYQILCANCNQIKKYEKQEYAWKHR